MILSKPDLHKELDGTEVTGKQARAASGILKMLANERRLMIFCLLARGEKTVGELEKLTSVSQPSVSQQLARLRSKGIVRARRKGRTVYYSLDSGEATKAVALLYNLYRRTIDGHGRAVIDAPS